MRGLSADSMDECAAPEELCATTHEHTTRKRQRAEHSTPAHKDNPLPHSYAVGPVRRHGNTTAQYGIRFAVCTR